MTSPADRPDDSTADGDRRAHEAEVNRRLGSVWRDSRLGPSVERMRRHILRDGDIELEVSQYRLLHALSEHGPMSMLALANLVGATQSSVSRSVARLEARSLVTRTRSEDDLRSYTIEMTGEGRVVHGYLLDRAFEVYGEIFAVFTVDEREVLASMLERLLKSVDATLEQSE